MIYIERVGLTILLNVIIALLLKVVGDKISKGQEALVLFVMFVASVLLIDVARWI